MKGVGPIARALRPGRGRGLARFVLVGGVLAVTLAVGLFAIGGAVSTAYAQFGYHPAENARSWAALTPNYAGSTTCQTCHADQYARWTGSKHAAVACETCHGPLAAHATAATPAAVTVPDSADLCATCHQKVAGRPVGFYQIVLADHFAGLSCIQCHNAHTTIAMPPTQVIHPLAGLPECVACHAATAFKPFPRGHQAASDSVCLSCHKPASASQ